jgi:nitrite reductase/ring-hydroxylating ferredoxin subunit
MSDDILPTSGSIKPRLARLTLADVQDGGAISLDLSFKEGRQSVIVTRRGQEVSAFLNRCPHARWPLDTFDGRFLFTNDGALICAAHSAVFDALTGVCLGGPGTGVGLTAVSIERDGDLITIEAKLCPGTGS